MHGGMRMDPRGLPVGMQEQAALKLAKEIAAKAGRVAGRGEGRPAQRVWPRRLRFRSGDKAEVYLRLRQGARDGVLKDVRCVLWEGVVRTVVVDCGQDQILRIRI